MAKPPPHYRIVFSGYFGAHGVPMEEWAFGLAADRPWESNDWLTKSELAPVAAALQPALVGVLGSSWQHARVSRIRVARVGDDGKYVRDGLGAQVYGDHFAGSGVGGGSTAAYSASFAHSLAVTTLSAINEPHGRGRFYIPAPITPLDPTGQMSTATTGQFADRARTFLLAVAAVLEPAGIGPLVVASAGSVPKGVPPGLRPITGVRVGGRPDVQQRRHRAIDETYAERSL